jgi:succinate-semialdehyde dehydrogenase/glutarate-semialdehyde dehydrogenase
MSAFKSVNPFTSETLATFPLADNAATEQLLAAADTAQKVWKKVSFAERAKRMLHLGKLITDNHEKLAFIATQEMGKTLTEAKLEVLKCVTACEYYAAHAEQFLAPQTTKHTDGRNVTLVHEPLGVVLGVFPWNFPYWQIIRSAVPVVMGGNTMLVKPAPNTPQCALALQELFDEAGLGNGIIHTIFINEEQIAALIADSRIKACTLTGSEKAGSAVASQAAKHIKKSVLELGGSDPFIVLADADLNLVMENAVSARFQNNGQSCIASKRYIIHKDVAEAFTSQLVNAVSKLKMGDPAEAGTHIGPVARIDLKEKLEFQVSESVKAGAKILYQAKNTPVIGCFYPPTILHVIPKSSIAYREELFGPVLSLFVVNSDEEAIALANDTEFGLGASIWTANLDKAAGLALQIESGQVFVNAVTRSNTAFPFGGIKKSGYGREMGELGIKEFCAIKSIWI